MNTILSETASSETTPLSAPREITMHTWSLIMSLAPTLHQSRFFKGISSPEQAAAVMLKGAELGFNLTGSFEYLDIIEGKVALKPVGALALLHRSKVVDIQITDEPDACIVTMTRRDTGFTYSARFGLDDALKAGLIKDRGAWTTYPAAMCRWRAVGICARIVAPDILAGLYLSSDLDGNVITGEVVQ